MIAVAVPAAWAAAVVAGSWSRRPAPRRVRRLLCAHRRNNVRHTPFVERLGGALLRVCRRPDDPLLALPNVVIAPHIASATVQTRNDMADICANNLIAGVTGQKLPAWVNPEVEGKRRS